MLCFSIIQMLIQAGLFPLVVAILARNRRFSMTYNAHAFAHDHNVLVP